MSQHDYTIANQGFPATRADINNALSAIATNNSGTSAPSTQYAGQFWIDTTSSTWTLYIHDGTDDIQFATIDTSANTVNFTDSALDVVTDTTPQLGGDLDLNSNDITGTGDINITGDITASGSLSLGTALPVAQGGTGLTSGFANGITMADQWRLTANTNSGTDADVTTNWERNDSSGWSGIGTGLTESSGIFTFPQTGIYYILYIPQFDIDATDAISALKLNITQDNSTFTTVADARANGRSGGVSQSSASSSFIFDVTNITNDKFKFTTSTFVGSTALLGSTTENRTHFTVIRLGDT